MEKKPLNFLAYIYFYINPVICRSPGSPAYGDRAAVCEEVLTVSLSCSRSELDMARINTEEEVMEDNKGDQELIQI